MEEKIRIGLKDKKCIICKKIYKGFGNNAEPLKKGYCCDDCNSKVIIARLTHINLIYFLVFLSIAIE